MLCGEKDVFYAFILLSIGKSPAKVDTTADKNSQALRFKLKCAYGY